MKQILLVCNAGMSTSMLVKKMQQSATERGIEISIQAKSMTEAKKNIHEADVILIGPQIRYELLAVKEIAGNIPVDTIDMRDYGMMNGAKVLEQALAWIGEMEYICFQLIANSGAAKSSFIEAIQLAKAGNLKEAKIKVEEAEDSLVEAHKIHSNLIQKEATGEKIGFSLLFMHAEDQMASTEIIQLLSKEFIELYQNK